MKSTSQIRLITNLREIIMVTTFIKKTKFLFDLTDKEECVEEKNEVDTKDVHPLGLIICITVETSSQATTQ